MLLPNRHGSIDTYRYGFQGQEKDDEIKGEGNSINYKYRMHDPRVGRFFAVDPLTGKYPYYSPYQFSGNKVISAMELEGLEEVSMHAIKAMRDLSVRTFAKNAFTFDPEKMNDYSGGISNYLMSINTFINNDRNLAAYALARYGLGQGGYDIFDVNLFKGDRGFESAYMHSYYGIEVMADNFLNNKGSATDVGYFPHDQSPLNYITDTGSTLGSFGMKYNVEMKKETNSDGDIIIKGTAYFTLADTYQWKPKKVSLYGAFIGSHSKLNKLMEVGAEEYSIRMYYTSSFTYSYDEKSKRYKINYTDSEALDNSYDLGKHPELSKGAGYRMRPGGLIIDWRPENTKEKNN
jgi:RHS repeat-associated protein